MPRFTRTVTRFALVMALAGSACAVPASAFASTSSKAPVKLLTCTNTTVSRPRNFIISCADANARLTDTQWTSWNATSATGTTRFALNLCQPYCAASKISYFANSTVRLTEPVTTKHGRLFSQLVVRYLLKGKMKSFSLSWSGDPSFS